MDEKMLNMAQEEYQRQYDSWLRMKPDQESIIDSFERIIEIIEKYKKKTDKEEGKKDE